MCPREDIQLIFELSKIIKSNLGLAEIFEKVHAYLPCLINFDASGYYLKEEKELNLRDILLALEEDCLPVIDQTKQQNILIEKIEDTYESRIYSDIIPGQAAGQVSPQNNLFGGLAFAMGAPIIADGVLWGVISLAREEKKGDFNNEELKKLELVANLLGIEIQKYRNLYLKERAYPSSQVEYDIDVINKLDEEYYGWHLLESLIAGIAREVRNPLANMKMAFYSLARNVAKNPGVQPDLEQMEHSLQRMDKALNFLLSLSRNQELNLVKLDVNKLLDEALEIVRTTFEPEVKVMKNYGTVSPVIMDKEKMLTVLSKIMENAVDAMPVGGTLQLTTKKDDDNVHIIIEDDGIGVDEKIRYCMFEPFVSSKPQNTGLGLTICKRIIEMHSGQISVRSNIDKGTVVSIQVPFHMNTGN